jgi:ATP-binding cassette subfamily F protein 3
MGERMLTVSNLSKRHGERLVLNRISFTINRSDRIGLVGPNGVGKSTLLSILAGEEEANDGSVSLTGDSRIGYLRQGFADLPGATLDGLLTRVSAATGALLTAEARLDEAIARMASPEAERERSIRAYDTALGVFERHGGYPKRDRLTTILQALDVGGVPFSVPLRQLSGGEKTRAGLAALLADQPDVLLLDEPTNHLDIDGLKWLEGFLASYPGAVLVVSHDRAFLDQAVTAILELDETTHELRLHHGTYSDYAAAKRAAAQTQERDYRRQQREVARVERDIQSLATHAHATERGTQDDFLRARAKKVARSAKVRERKLERALASEERIERPERRWEIAPEFGTRIESSRDVARVETVSVELDGACVLRDIDLHVRFGERIALTGPNGSGKTTLIRLLAGEITPSEGQVQLGPDVVVGRYDQEQELVAADRTVLEQVRATASLSETDARSFLHRYLFGGDMVFQLGGELSYGERARLALALLVLRGANFLLLDEPLNHLDLPSRERFEEALTGFGGTTIIVLHDRYAIDRLATRMIELRRGKRGSRVEPSLMEGGI